MMEVPFFDLKQQYQTIRAEVEPEVLKVLESCAYVGGSYVQKMEEEFAAYLKVNHAVGCSSGTSALILALRACGVGPGDEVITTPFTFFATAEAIACIGAVPVFVDVLPEDYTMDPEKIEAAITDKTKAVLPVHIFGAVCQMDKIVEIARKYNLKVIEDAAQAAGSEYFGRKAGTLGDIGCFSFYPTKNLGGCGDGGMVTTNDDQLDIILRALHEHGAGCYGAKAAEFLNGVQTASVDMEQGNGLYQPYKYFNYLIGYNARLDALQACVLLVKLKYLDVWNEKRAAIAARYLAGLTDQVRLPSYSDKIKTCWHQFVICSEYKQELGSYLSEKGVGNGTFYPVPLHQQKAFTVNNCKTPPDGLPVAEKLSAQSVCLPVYPEMTDEQVQYVIDRVNEFYKERI